MQERSFADRKADVVRLQQRLVDEVPDGLWPTVRIDAEVTSALELGLMGYRVGSWSLPVVGPRLHASAPWTAAYGMCAGVVAVAMGRCPACGRSASLGSESDAPSWLVLDVPVDVDHHAACPASPYGLSHWWYVPFGDRRTFDLE